LKDKSIIDLSPPHFDTVTCLGSVGRTLISGSKDKMLRLWDLNTLECKYSHYNAHRDVITCMTTDTQYFYTGCKDSTIKVWEVPQSS